MLQPVFELGPGGRRLHHVEGLTHGPRGTPLAEATALFEDGSRRHQTAMLDKMALATQIEASRRLLGVVQVSLNVHASTLAGEPDFVWFLVELCGACGVLPSHLIVEITATTGDTPEKPLVVAIRNLRGQGIAIALDDFGLGCSNLDWLVELSPDYLKLGQRFVQGCHRSSRGQVVLGALELLSRRVGARLIAKGVEHRADLEMLKGLGVSLAQGFCLSPPLSVREVEALVYR